MTPTGAREAQPLGSLVGSALADHAVAEGEFVRAIVAALARERALGHVCIDLDELAGKPAPGGEMVLPAVADCRDRLAASGLCARPGAERVLPLVLDESDQLYFHRDYHNEQRILEALRVRLAAPPAMAAAELRGSLAELGELPAEPLASPDWQLAALAAAAAGRFLVITGGPGTGKTTTIARLIALLRQREPGLRVALAAPTGKAAARMGEAMASHGARQPGSAAAEIEPKTLHRLLGYLPLDDAFRAGPDRPLAFDLVVIDEASMLDPALFAVLLEALPASARLVLVGDRDQLAAVAAGQVLGDLCRAARPDAGVGTGLAEFLREAADLECPVQSGGAPLANAVVALRTNHRFGRQPGLDRFAQALARRDVDAALQVLDAGHADLSGELDPDRVLETIGDDLLAAVRAAPDDAIAHLARLRILAATRHGAMGTEAWNGRVEAMLRRHGVRVDDPWYPGRPILVTANDQQNRIWNGDLGVTCRDPNGQPQVAFSDGAGGVRLVSTFRVPAHETAWAMTVHKAQGSEFDTVVLSMPDSDGPLWQAPLIYTGITRARRRAILVAERPLLSTGLGRWPRRSSGLADGLAL